MSLEEYSEYLQSRRWTGDLYRRRWLYPRLRRHLQGRTLDIGAGIGDMLAFRPGTEGVDINPQLVAYCRDRGFDIDLMGMDGSLPHPDNVFASVLLDNVLEHVADPALLLAEIRRVLIPQGSLLVGVPGERGFAADSDHKRFYTYPDLVHTFGEYGFIEKASFAMPLWRSPVLSRKLRMYCEYVHFQAPAV